MTPSKKNYTPPFSTTLHNIPQIVRSEKKKFFLTIIDAVEEDRGKDIYCIKEMGGNDNRGRRVQRKKTIFDPAAKEKKSSFVVSLPLPHMRFFACSLFFSRPLCHPILSSRQVGRRGFVSKGGRADRGRRELQGYGGIKKGRFLFPNPIVTGAGEES